MRHEATKYRTSHVFLLAGWCALTGSALTAVADPGKYERGVDPGVGFNLVSWANFGSSGAVVWEDAVQSAYDAGFDEVSLSPVRYYTPGVGSIAQTSGSGPELSHVAAGVIRAKSLGMRVTVNPFIEPVGFSGWRGFYDPTPNSGEWNTFWTNYQQYVVDVATMAETSGADSLTVGTELRALTRNVGNNAKWGTMLGAANSAFSGTLGYAANWDNYNHNNVVSAIWENPAIDYIGIDSYFQGLLSDGQADASGTYRDASFIGQVENAWNNKLDGEILPFAAARKAGAGMPVEFTEIGYLPYNRTTTTPQNNSGPLDQDEQNMAFEGFMSALDGRLGAGEFLAAHIWQWDMPGSGGSAWNMNPQGGNQPTNQQTAQWLSDFVTNQDEQPTGSTQVLYSFESGLDGFFYPNYEPQPASTLAQVGGTGATDGTHSLAITKPTPTWTWDAKVQMSGAQLDALQTALLDNIDDYVLEIDVTYAAGDLPTGLTDLNMHVSIDTDLDEWSQNYPFADISGPTSQTFQVEIPLNAFDISSGIGAADLHLGFAGDFTGSATIYIDRIALTDTTFVAVENADFDGDGDVDGADFLAWQRGLKSGTMLSQGDANSDGTVDAIDLEIWQGAYGVSGLGDTDGDSNSSGADFLNLQRQFGSGLPLVSSSTSIPEPSTRLLVLIALLFLSSRYLMAR